MQKIPPSAFALIIGAMKSGTSSLYRYVQRHPRICGCRTKEPEFFSEFPGTSTTKVERYEALWDYDPGQHAYCLEASTGYTKYPIATSVPANIFRYGLRPRFIYIVRHPIDRIASQYNFDRLYLRYRLKEDPLEERFINSSRYFLQLSRYLEYFPDKRNYLILDFDEIKCAPDGLTDQVFDFLNLERVGATDADEYEVFLKTPDRTRLEQSLRRYSALRFIKNKVPDGLIDMARTTAARLSGSAKRQLSDDEKGVLYDQLYGDMQRFKEEFGFDVGKWGF